MPTFIVEQYELHVQKWMVEAQTRAEAVRNMLENAAQHANDGGTVAIETKTDDSMASLLVRNTGSRVSQDDAERVCERFWRGDASRNLTGVHSGLGLALVRRVAVLLGGDVSVRSSVGGDFEIEVSFESSGMEAMG